MDLFSDVSEAMIKKQPPSSKVCQSGKHYSGITHKHFWIPQNIIYLSGQGHTFIPGLQGKVGTIG